MIPMFRDNVEVRWRMIVRLALSAVVLTFAGCNHDGHPRSINAKAIVYSREDLIDLKGYCVSQGETPEDCKGEEGEFVGQFSTAFQTEPMCSGLQLLIDSGADTSKSASQELERVKGRAYWRLLIDPVYPISQHGNRAWFSLHLEPTYDLDTTAKGTPATIAHTVCSLAKGVGGTIVE